MQVVKRARHVDLVETYFHPIREANEEVRLRFEQADEGCRVAKVSILRSEGAFMNQDIVRCRNRKQLARALRAAADMLER